MAVEAEVDRRWLDEITETTGVHLQHLEEVAQDKDVWRTLGQCRHQESSPIGQDKVNKVTFYINLTPLILTQVSHPFFYSHPYI